MLKIKAMDYNSHYKKIAEKYNYFYGPARIALVDQVLLKHLKLEAEDHLLDLGAGTGLVTSIIRNSVQLKNPSTCVEPCEAFMEQLNALDGVVAVLNTAEGFYDENMKQKPELPFNKVIIIGCIHHFCDPVHVLDNIIKLLPKGGTCIIACADRRKSRFPLPFSALLLQEINCHPTVSDDILPFLQKRTDAVTEVFDEPCTWEVEKKRWYDMIRGRFLSYFEKFSDEELEMEIEEMDKEKFSDVKDHENITVHDTFIITKTTKTC